MMTKEEQRIVAEVRPVLCKRMWETGQQSGTPCNGYNLVCGTCDVTAHEIARELIQKESRNDGNG